MTNVAEWRWTASNLLMLCCVYGFQADKAYIFKDGFYKGLVALHFGMAVATVQVSSQEH